MSKIIVRRKTVTPPVIVVERWKVLVAIGDEMEEFFLTCEREEFASAMRRAGFDISDPNLDYVRERVAEDHAEVS